jgi:glycosyltransferase involved in cell wall biosynthesis
MPSRTEGFPNGLGEAMSMGLACVATQVGDTQILTADTVILVAPEDPKALASGLTQLIDMPDDQRQLLGHKAASRVRNQFSIDKARERFYMLYRDVMESSH